jgi:hypothetical protein
MPPLDADHFDALLAALTAAPSRRAALRVLGGLGLTGLFGRTDAKKKDRKKKCAKAGQPTSKKRKKCCKGLVKDASRRCAACKPATCSANGCGSVPDGCGGTRTCGCPANHICLRSGTCQACTVTCTGTPAQCGTALKMAMSAGGTVYVCPGRYQGGFALSNAVTVIGAGEGADATSNTILDAAGAFYVLETSGTAQVALERLHVTGGTGSGIRHSGTKLRMTECTVSGNGGLNAFGAGINTDKTLEMTRCTVRNNHATGQFGAGAGLAIAGGISTTTILTDCLIETNIADSSGGGFWISGGTTTLAGTQVRGNMAFYGGAFRIQGGTLAMTEDCRVTENIAPSGHGGGIYITSGAVALLGPDPSPIVVNNCHENCAPIGDVPKCAVTPVSC